MSRPGDWMKDPNFLAPIGHIGWGALITLSSAFLGGVRVGICVAIGLFLTIVIKEYLVDPHVESNEDAWTGTIDLAGWTGGILIALAIVWIHSR